MKIPLNIVCAAILMAGMLPMLAASTNETAKPASASAVQVRVNASEAPDLAPWLERGKSLVEEWHPKISALLASDNFTPPQAVKLACSGKVGGVGGTSGNLIVFSADYVRQNSNDWGALIHELTHVVQYYPPGGPGWLVEGIADYVRLAHFEPKAARPPIDFSTASYRDGYKTTAMFLIWIEANKDKDIVKKLNAALRQQKYRPEIFKDATGKTLDELWREFAAAPR